MTSVLGRGSVLFVSYVTCSWFRSGLDVSARVPMLVAGRVSSDGRLRWLLVLLVCLALCVPVLVCSPMFPFPEFWVPRLRSRGC